MTNKLTTKGKVFNGKLFGKGGYIEDYNVICPIPKTAEEISNRFVDVPVEQIRSFGNRDTNVESINKLIDNRGGIDGSMWLARGARVKGDPNKTVWIYDGDHSRHMYLGQHPNSKTIPIWITEVDNFKEVNKLFVACNKTGRTSITAEQVLVNEFHCGESEAIRKDSFLEQIGAMVYCSHESEGKIGDSNGCLMKVTVLDHLDKIAKKSENYNDGIASVKRAIELSTSIHAHKADKPVSSHISRALSMVFASFPSLRNSGMKAALFDQWFREMANGLSSNVLINVLQDSNHKGHQDSYFVAKGIINAARKKQSSLDDSVKRYLGNKTLMRQFNKAFRPS